MWWIRGFFDNIKRIIKWFPIIWRDREWDDDYLYIIMREKLSNMYEALTSDEAVAVHCDNHLKKLKICILLLNRIIDDTVYMDLSTSIFRRYDINNISLVREREISRPWVTLTIHGPYTREEFLAWNGHIDYLQKQDMDMLFDIMKKYSKYWWD